MARGTAAHERKEHERTRDSGQGKLRVKANMM